MSAADASELVCPKCQGVMRSYERNGVTIDQCTECRGIFLDRGELERLIDAEGTYSDRSRDDRHRGGEHDASKPQRKRGGFLSELFGD